MKRDKQTNTELYPCFRTSTNYRFFEKKIPDLDKTRITESAGYLTAKQRIENMILAGQRLVDFRKEQFDFQGQEIDETFTDPTREKNFDLADASNLKMQNDLRLKQQKKVADDKKQAELEAEAEKSKNDKVELENYRKKEKNQDSNKES